MRSSAVIAATFYASLVACGGNPPPAPAAAAPAGSAPAAGSVDAGAPAAKPAVDAAALEKLTAGEAKSGACDADHKAALEKALDAIEAKVRAKTDEGKPLKIESFTKRTLALSEASKGVQLTLSGKGTEVHVIAISPKEVSMDVLAGNQPATTTRSAYKPEVIPTTIELPKIGREIPLEGDSRQVEMKPGTPLDVRMRGQGCAGLVIFSKT
jgi:hypothetical protein